jgi:hypothetical protein
LSESSGQKLFRDWNILQASCLKAEHIPNNKLLEWTNTFSKPQYRGQIKRIKKTSLLLIVTQNCDIAAREDHLDSCIELIVCKKIDPKDCVPFNQFVRGTRKLQFNVNKAWYEASSEYLLTVEKEDLLNTIEDLSEFDVISLASEFAISVPLWRANRYSRIALPDNFNNHLLPALDQFRGQLESLSITDGIPVPNHIRAIYIWLNTLDEVKHYTFELFALIREKTPDELLTKTQNILEDLALHIESKSSYIDQSQLYADREDNTYVSYLTRFTKLNLDHISLSKGDSDTGPDITN